MEDKGMIPSHVSIIMDGNGRWAKQRGKERFYGHIEGVESVRACVEAAVENKHDCAPVKLYLQNLNGL